MARNSHVDDSNKRVGHISHAVDRKDLKPGDHIYVYKVLGSYQHHGIYIGEKNIEVIHFSGDPADPLNMSQAKIQVTTLNEFLDGGQLRLVAYGLSKFVARIKIGGSSQSKMSLPAKNVIATAKHYAQNPDEWPPYHLLNNNCEKFAIYCKTGELIEAHKELNQQKRVFEGFVGTAGAIIGVGVGIALIMAGHKVMTRSNRN